MGEEEESDDNNLSLEDLMEAAKMSLSSKKSEICRNNTEREEVAKSLSDRGALAEKQLNTLMTAYDSVCSFDSTRLFETIKLRHCLSDLESRETSLRRGLALLKRVNDDNTQESSDVVGALGELSEEIKRLTECRELDIVDSLYKIRSIRFLTLREQLQNKVASVAEGGAFPSSDFQALLQLQLLLFKDKQDNAHHHDSVWALDAIIKPTEIRFGYHFFSGQPTDRADRPEWLLSFARKELETRANSLCGEVQVSFDSVAAAGPLEGLSCLAYFTKCLVSLLRLKILAWLPELLPNDSLLAAALDEFLSFDAWVEGRVGYSVQCKRHPYMIWPTLSDIICTHDARFSRWVDLDKTYAREKYRAFAEVSGNWKAIVFKFLERELKVTTSQPPPTYIAKTVGMMFHEVNSRYQGIREVHRRLKYAINIQIMVVKLFIGDLQQRSKDYDAAKLMKLSYEEIPEGWENFSCIVNSAGFFLDLLQEAEDDAHYVELSQAAAESQQLSTGASHPTPMLSLFAEDILALKDLIDFTVSDASQACCDMVVDTMFAYKRTITRSSFGIPDDALNLLQEPCKLLQIVTSCVKMLQPTSHRQFFLAVSSKLDLELLKLVHEVSPTLVSYGVEKFKQGVEALGNSLQSSLRRQDNYFLTPFPCVLDTLVILSLGQTQLMNLCASLKALSGDTDEEQQHCREALEQFGVQSLVREETITLLDRALA